MAIEIHTQQFEAIVDREEKVLSLRNEVDLGIVEKTLNARVDLPNTEVNNVSGILDASDAEFSQALDTALQVRRDFSQITKIDKETLQTMLEREEEKANAYREIRQKASKGKYNGSSSTMYSLTSFLLGSYFSTASECYDLLNKKNTSKGAQLQETTVFSRD